MIADALRLSDKRIVITGAGGWLGLASLELLESALDASLSDRVRCFGASRRTLLLLSGRSVEQHPLAELAALEEAPTLLLHLAFLTKDRAEDMAEPDYRQANRALSASVLECIDRIGTAAVFVASSGAARFANDPLRSPAMRLYGELKRTDEDQFADWADARRARAVISRIFNLAGPHINKVASYALSALILDALAGRPIEVKAPHRVVRGYVAVRELMALIFALLLEPAPAVMRFDTGGDPMELEQVANVIAAELGGAAVRAPISSAANDVYVGDRESYDRLLLAHGIAPVPFAEQVRETSDFLQRSCQDALRAGSS